MARTKVLCGAGVGVLVLACLLLSLFFLSWTSLPTDGQGSPQSAASGAAGQVHVEISTNAQWDAYTKVPSKSMQQWLRGHSWRMLTFSPYFDSRLSWYPDAWVYLDLYAIYQKSPLLTSHPEWVLKDSNGNPLYIPWGCSGGTCPQYAGDIANPMFRNWWIAQARQLHSTGYHGLWIDDVNLEFRVSDGNGKQAAPIDTQTGAPMLYDDWRRYVAEFTEQIRAAFPGWEIVHNAIWFADTPARDSDPYVHRELVSADYINVEHGLVDPGLTGGNGIWSLNALLGYIDRVHQLGPAVVVGDRAGALDYAVASYFLISQGRDALSSSSRFPDRWGSGLDVDLGAPLSPRRSWQGVLRRDFTNGMTLVNPPQSPVARLTLPATFLNLDGTAAANVVLQPADGIVLLNAFQPPSK